MVLCRTRKILFQLLNACSVDELRIGTRQVKKVRTRWVLASLLCPHPFPTFAPCSFFYSDCSWALSFTSGPEVSGESVFYAGWQEAYGVSEKQLGKGAKCRVVSMGFPWISLWTSRSWTGRVPVPVPSCLQGSKMRFSTWETSVQSYWNGLLLPSVLDSQTLALISTGSRISVSCLLLSLYWNSWRVPGLPEGTPYKRLFLERCCIRRRCACLVPRAFMAALALQSTTGTNCAPNVLPRLRNCTLEYFSF